MKHINKILLLFICFMGISWLIFWQLVHSSLFSDYVSIQFKKYFRSQYNISLNFKGFDLQLFPVAIDFKDISLEGNKILGDNIVAFQVSHFRVQFKLFDLFAQKLSIKKIEVYESELFLGTKNNKITKDRDELDLSTFLTLYPKINEWMKNGPAFIYNIEFKNLALKINDRSLDITLLDIYKYRNKLDLRFKLNGLVFEPPSPFILDGEMSMYPDKIEIKNIELTSDTLFFYSEGSLVKKSVRPYFDLKIKSSGQVGGIIDHFSWGKNLLVRNGHYTVQGTFNGDPEKYLIDLNANINSIESKYFNLQQIHTKVKIDQDFVDIDDLEIKNHKENIKLLKKHRLFDLRSKTFLPEGAPIRIKDAELETILYCVKDDLKGLKGLVSGDVEVSFNKEFLDIEINKIFNIHKYQYNPVENATNEDLLLGGQDVLIGPSKMKVNFENGEFEFDIPLIFKSGELTGRGYIKKDDINVELHSNNLNISEIGSFSGANLEGVGKVDTLIRGTSENTKFLINMELFQSRVLGLNLGESYIDLLYDLNLNKLTINKGHFEYKNSIFDIDGYIRFEDKDALNLNIDAKEITFENSVEILNPILSKISNWNEHLDLKYQGTFNLKSTSLGPETIVLNGDFKASQFRVFDEDFDNLKGKIEYRNRKVDFVDININKEKGNILGDLNYDFKLDQIIYKFISKETLLSQWNWPNKYKHNLNGVTYFETEGNGHLDKLNSKILFKMEKVSILNKRVKSPVELYLELNDGQITKGHLNFLDDILNLALVTDKSTNNLINIIGTFKLDDFTEIYNIFNSKNYIGSTLKGYLEGHFKTSLNPTDIKHFDLDFKIDDFYYLYNGKGLNLIRYKNDVTINKGNIKNWDILIRGDAGVLSSKGTGKIFDQLRISNFLNIDAQLLEVFIPIGTFISGHIENKFMVSGDDDTYSVSSTSSSQDLALGNTDGSFRLKDITYKLSFAQNRLLFEEFKAKLGEGQLKLGGEIKFDSSQTKLNLNFRAKDSNLNFLNKSGLELSGSGRITGDQFPYLVEGDLIISKGKLFDEFAQFGKTSTARSNKYIPKKKKSFGADLFTTKLSFEFIDDLHIQNSMVDLNLKGKGTLLGPIRTPRINGQLTLSEKGGKFLFRNSDFNVIKGSILFNEQSNDIDPKIDFLAETKIADHVVFLKVFGKATDFDLDLSSDPAASQKDILSLLTLGFTGDVSANLSEKERANLASVGIGSIIFDKLQLTDELKSSLGVDLNVLPEFSESDDSYASSGDGGGQGVRQRYKSGTKLQVSKRLTKDVDLSVSRTVGGNIGSKSEMNLNYKLKRNVALEGVYEQKTGNEKQQTSNSVGADFNFRWKFK